jgi:hypothetical protein
VAKTFIWLDISGMKDNRLISNPIQAPSHELDEIEIKIPLTGQSPLNKHCEY